MVIQICCDQCGRGIDGEQYCGDCMAEEIGKKEKAEADVERLERESAEAFADWYTKAFPLNPSIKRHVEIFISEECGGFARDMTKAEEEADRVFAALAAKEED